MYLRKRREQVAWLVSAALCLAVFLGHGVFAAIPVSSTLIVTMPQEDAQLLINDTRRSGAGVTREHNLPLLIPGHIYRYTFSASWRPNNYTEITRSRVVEFKGGDPVQVDLATESAGDRARVRYVPTPDNIVRTMIRMAQIGPGDVIYEPGCGDARTIIAAVKAGARRAVGIDLDPERVAEAKARVKAAGLEDQIEIRLGDALDMKDLSEAAVVFLYMGDEFDMLMRPILWRDLKSGARVVSHRFTMGDWKPDRSENVLNNDDHQTYQVHLWTITPDVKAAWFAGRESYGGRPRD